MDTLPFCVQVGVLENGTPAETDQAILETAAIRKINAQAERKTFFRVDFEFVMPDSLFLIFFARNRLNFSQQDIFLATFIISGTRGKYKDFSCDLFVKKKYKIC